MPALQGSGGVLFGPCFVPAFVFASVRSLIGRSSAVDELCLCVTFLGVSSCVPGSSFARPYHSSSQIQRLGGLCGFPASPSTTTAPRHRHDPADMTASLTSFPMLATVLVVLVLSTLGPLVRAESSCTTWMCYQVPDTITQYRSVPIVIQSARVATFPGDAWS